MKMVSVEQAIQDMKNGKMIVMVDDVDRENEGDLIFPATFTSAEKVNFAITHARGVVCVALDEEIAKRLDLPLMVDKNTSSHETAFTITIDAKDATTGVSAYERNMTIELMARPNSTPSDFVRPGHINPLIAKKGGVLVRTGHTEGSVDLCKLAGIAPSAVICEIVNEDGTMARRDDLEKFCEKFGINMISIAQIVEYRLKHETLVKFGEFSEGKICGKSCKVCEITDHDDNAHKVFIFGEIGEICNVKFHKISSDLEFMQDENYDDFMQNLEILSTSGGVIVALNSASHKGDFKSYGIGAQILAHLGIKKIKILSNSSPKEYAGLSGFGIDII
ncbi:bifunctional 3,4-dihydroxy-2-butanone 4-phosphate synthase/GTP cyclohydrolase II [Campylobacter sp. JMF_01 NE2]|uniref:bifunctional 3,4-dihydroxy-2-butanone 4-phosphate synthase/GTP cyclohydrolase II n=1 Tax=unclassified Campylobacter TaxID=2593542 RepID=UPI0022E9B7A9|nr:MULTISPECIES: bifunctional 3,4-dihydroxy-2-butanone 4-phosphate synthase/GTP cyclohydrolase II [unclassified Campylobacter]MDA3051899.1 bifunctional 3,4-dihydroxy-2-butanone 4-phosphate synthase/GTP cyclohydrolase II [Campylobacter sp. JMF_03 NE3]MDA3066233.1 bifunctional 3,4-dihydroxy-2-butanone 4-phosphate synthase/GTP cyclohydrolase II [Campylobacter sp. JMF_01 NE2]